MLKIMDIPNSKGCNSFWEAYRARAEENRLASDRLPLTGQEASPISRWHRFTGAYSLGVPGIEHCQKRIGASTYSNICVSNPRGTGYDSWNVAFSCEWPNGYGQLFRKSPLAPLCQRGVIPPFTKGRGNHTLERGKVWKRGRTILLLIHVDKKKTHKDLVLGFFNKPHSQPSLNLLGQSKANSPQGIPKE